MKKPPETPEFARFTQAMDLKYAFGEFRVQLALFPQPV
jgi:hypothetical protein